MVYIFMKVLENIAIKAKRFMELYGIFTDNIKNVTFGCYAE